MVEARRQEEGRRETALEELWGNFVRLWRDGLTTLLVPWLTIALVDLLFVGVSIGVVLATGGAEPGRGAMGVVQTIGVIQGVLIMTLRVALLWTLREVGFRGPTAVRNLGDVARAVGQRLGSALGITVVMGVIVSVGLVLCVVPGLVALFFLAFAPYLVVAKGLGVVESLGESARWAQRQWAVLLTALVVAIVASGVLACVVGVIGGLGGQGSAPISMGLLGGWAVNTVLGYVAFLWWGAVYLSAEEREQVEALQSTAPPVPEEEA